MSPPLVMLLAVAVTLMTPLAGEDNELDYGYWNYREGADRVNVNTVRSVTRLLDHWGNRIFTEVKNLLHSQPNSVLPDYSRVRPLSESLSDLFREVTLLQRRVVELTDRLAKMEAIARRHGYRGRRTGVRAGPPAPVPRRPRPQSARRGGAFASIPRRVPARLNRKQVTHHTRARPQRLPWRASSQRFREPLHPHH
ncbi:uncharacterized protein [Lepisosteus oculatus]|nr:PREDICTED: uncharacterized protein LOC102690692 isoform X2 [Lepisosteus oculatus]